VNREIDKDDSATTQTIKRVILVLNIIGFTNLILTVAFSWDFAIGAISCMIGVLATALAFVIKSKGFILSGVILTMGIFIAGFGIDLFYSIGSVRTTPVDAEIVAPDHMKTIDRTGSVYNLVSRGFKMYFYFSNEDQDDSEFLLLLENVMVEADSLDNSYSYFSRDGFYVMPGYHNVYYFDTKLMPADETESVFSLLDIDTDSVPCLVMVSEGVIVRSVNTADEQSIKNFIFGDESSLTTRNTVFGFQVRKKGDEYNV